MPSYRIQQLELCHTEMFGDLVLTCRTSGTMPERVLQPVPYRRSFSSDVILQRGPDVEKRRATALVDQLLLDIYSNAQFSTDYNSATSGKSHKSVWVEVTNFSTKDADELKSIIRCLRMHVERMGSVLVRQLKRRDALRRQQDTHCDVITRQLAKFAQGSGEVMRFTIQPGPGESDFSQWAAAMKMVAQLPGGIPPEFRRRLWLTLAERHLISQGVDWAKVERNCFSEWSHPADSELGVQIVKDLHRTGCSLFCGEDGQENQALLKRVLLAYARWNKAVGYCQGFNMLAALILQVTEKCESEALKLMIYLIEGVLPESYFADSLRGLSVDMAVFRELLRSKLPRLSKHLDTLQNAAKDGNTSYEPPLTNVFTMQWFLTLFCNCLPQPTVLRVWDLILLEGNEILLRTALAIWQTLADRILSVRSADEFYCIMGVLTRELLESGLLDANTLIKAVVSIGPLTELGSLRDHYMYNINPWGGLQQAVVEKQLKLYPREKLALDISALKKQYVKLKQRQRQAHIIFSAAISRQPPASAPVAMNHLLLGKSALVPARRLGPPKGAIPPARQIAPTTLHWKDTQKNGEGSSDSSDTELCDEGTDHSDNEESGQLDDNPSPSDTNLMNTDNTSARTTLEEPPCQINSNSVDAASTSTLAIPVKVESAESDEENFEFEKFLADRVRCLKQPSLTEDGDEEEKLRYGRRNSERALQIIQENSLILHRILQCQSRLSPSPPLLRDRDEENFETSDIKASVSVPEITTTAIPSSPEYGNKYTSILEKSKSLDEKYNSLILNQPPSKKSEESGTIAEEKLISLSPCNNDESIVDTAEIYSLSPLESPKDIKVEDSSLKFDFTSFNYGSRTDKSEEIKSPDVGAFDAKYEYKPFVFNESASKVTDLQEYPKSPSKSPDRSASYGLSVVNSDSTDNAKVEEPMLTIEEIKSKYSKNKSRPSSFYEKSFSDDQKETFSRFSSLGFRKLYSPDTQSHLSELSDYTEAAESILDGLKLEENQPQSANELNLDLRSDADDSKTCYNYIKSPVNEYYPQFTSSEFDLTPGEPQLPVLDYLRSTRSPTSDLPMDKSPSKVFNPFPVPLSSRQSKEVPLKLGLYKK